MCVLRDEERERERGREGGREGGRGREGVKEIKGNRATEVDT